MHTDFMSWVAENVEYPKEAAKRGFNGKVAVAFDVSAEGYVENARVLTGAAYIGGSTSSPRWTEVIPLPTKNRKS